MDTYEATRIVFSRIQSLDPDNAAKIMGVLLIQDHGDKEMIRLAFGPEALVHSIVLKARKELGLLPPSTPSTPSSSPSPFSRHNSTSRLLGGGNSNSNSSGLPSPSSWSSPPVFSRCNSANGNGSSSAVDDRQNPEELMGAAASSAPSPFYGSELIDEFQLQDQLSFLNDPPGANSSSNSSIHGFPFGPKGSNSDLFYSDMVSECRSPRSNGGDNMLFPYTNWGGGLNGHHRRSCSAADLYTGSETSGFGWKPCLYFANGYCKNGSNCRFQHGLPDDVTAAAAAVAAMSGGKMDAMVEQQCQELLLRSKSQRLGSVASSQLMGSAASFPYATSPSPTSGKCMNLLLHQQQNDRAGGALMMGGDESHKFFGRSRMDRYDYAGLVNPGSRQIYLTFPADSTFREEDVSNYFSIYGPVQDVRIPYQQKRMFGFVTFVYPETVKMILAKGNPHFVCDARVLVKPYKEKGKVPDKKLQQQHQSERGDFSGCTTPTGGLDSRDPFELQQLGARMTYNSNQELLLRRKLEEQQQAAELQQAIELQRRRFMGLQLLDLKHRNASLSSPSTIHTPSTVTTTPTSKVAPGNHEGAPTEGKCSSPDAPAAAAAAAAPDSDPNDKVTVNAAASSDKVELAVVERSLHDDSDFQESDEHNLPDSPFASPTRSSLTGTSLSLVSEATEMASSANGSNSGSLLLGPSSLDMTSIKSCFLPMPRFSSSGHGAVGL